MTTLRDEVVKKIENLERVQLLKLIKFLDAIPVYAQKAGENANHRTDTRDQRPTSAEGGAS